MSDVGSLVLIAAHAGPAAPTAHAANFVLVNTTGMTLDRLYISPCAGPHWGANQLAGSPGLSSRAFTISNLRPGCYDVMVVMPPWNECVVTGVAVLRSVVWRVTWSTAFQSEFGDCSQTAHV